MLNVLIVDDDRLVRQGLKSAMPWAEYGMCVVGEAGNGEKALEFLQEHQVDLLVTDLAMPVMSGIELMRMARKRYPALKVVVLSMHQDFEYVQEALRMGAVDYIAKHQLEKERFDEVLSRIRQRMDSTKGERQKGQSNEHFVWISTGDLQQAGLPTLRKQMDSCLHQFSHKDIHQYMSVAQESLEEIGNGIWVSGIPSEMSFDSMERELHAFAACMDGFLLMAIEGAGSCDRERLCSLIRRYRQVELFYDHPAEEKFFRKPFHELEEVINAPSPHDPGALRAFWTSLQWVYMEQRFYEELEKLHQLRLPESKLKHLLGAVEQAWNVTYGALAVLPKSTFGEMNSWSEVKKKLEEMRLSPRDVTGEHRHTPEIVGCVLRAVKIVKEEYATPLYAITLARRVSMSRSHFCHCFKEITGHAFNAYLRRIRMEKARELIIATSLPLQHIAEQVGYQDEKYFSKVFRETTGLLPSEFRRASGSKASDDR